LPDAVTDDIIDKARKINVVTTMGQTYDFRAATFSFECYNIIVENKTSYYTVWLPFMLGMIASQKIPADRLNCDSLKALLLRMGYYFQVQDDFLDVYGDPQTTGKVGTDILDGKVTWLACKAVSLATEEQKAILGSNYRKDQNKVLEIYEQLKIREHYEAFEVEQTADMHAQLAQLDPIYPKRTLDTFLRSLTRRRS
jgi:farnesyl diphosphate synthase